MTKQMLLLCLALLGLAASAQPTFFGGITPGKTTREDLKSLVLEPDRVDTVNHFEVKLKQPENQLVSISLQNDVVYKVSADVNLFNEVLKQALIEKYGQPTINAGTMGVVICQNGYGASIRRQEGRKELQWPVKNGIQGAIVNTANGNCGPYYSSNENFELSHVATVRAIEEKRKEMARKKAEDERRKFNGAF
jgi:hypothetical protein